MPIKFLMFLFFTWTMLHTIFGLGAQAADITPECTAAGVSYIDCQYHESNEQFAALSSVAYISVIHFQEVYLIPFDIPVPSATFFVDIKTLVTFDYSVFEGSYGTFVRMLLLMPLSFATLLLFIPVPGPVMVSAGSLLTSTFIGPISRLLGGAFR